MTLQDSLAALLVEHDYNGGSGSVEYCLCGWEGQSGHAHHVAEVQAVWLRDHFTEIAAELGLTREARTLDDGHSGTATNWATGEVTFSNRPCTVVSRYVTEWRR